MQHEDKYIFVGLVGKPLRSGACLLPQPTEPILTDNEGDLSGGIPGDEGARLQESRAGASWGQQIQRS